MLWQYLVWIASVIVHFTKELLPVIACSMVGLCSLNFPLWCRCLVKINTGLTDRNSGWEEEQCSHVKGASEARPSVGLPLNLLKVQFLKILCEDGGPACFVRLL